MRIFIILIFLLISSNTFAKNKFSEVRKALKEDGYGKAIPEKFHHLNSPKAINPVSVSNFSIIGNKSIRFESNNGECWQEPKWSDCENDRERTELYYKKKPWKKNRWYTIYFFSKVFFYNIVLFFLYHSHNRSIWVLANILHY